MTEIINNYSNTNLNDMTTQLFNYMMAAIFPYLIAILFTSPVFAQISIGGKPLGFNEKFNFNEGNLSATVMPAVDMEKINAEDEETAKMGNIPRFAVLIPISLNLDNSGTWTVLPGGDRIWRLKIQSPGALALTFHYDNFYLPEGAVMYIYSEDKSDLIGGFTKANNHASKLFATSLVKGDVSIIEYFEPQKVAGRGRISISGVGHAYRMVRTKDNASRADFCEVDVVCSPEGDDWINESKSVVKIAVVVAPNGLGWCSGSLINNTNTDCVPYILTAFHCGVASTMDNFNQYIFYFNNQRTTCDSGIVSDDQSITGAIKRAEGDISGSDFLLLELNDPVPLNYNAYYSGWNAENVASPSGVGIHHPAGEEKKISTYTTPLTTTGWTMSNTHWQVLWSETPNGHGVTEGGSSGSPIYDNNKRIVGTLTGGGSSCSDLAAPDAYGKMSWHWTENTNKASQKLHRWLDPNNTGALTLDGTFSPCGTVFPNDAGIFAIYSPESDFLTCQESVSPHVIIRNYGSDTLTSITVNYQINSDSIQTQKLIGLSLATNDMMDVKLDPIQLSVPGIKTFKIHTSNPNGTADDKPENDSRTNNFTFFASNPTASVPFHQDFESSAFPPEEWTRQNPDNARAWVRNSSLGAFDYSTACAMIENFGYTSRGQRDYLITPEINFTGLISPVTLDFSLAYAKYANHRKDTLKISATTDCGVTWTKLYANGISTLPTNGGENTKTPFTPTATEWRIESINLDHYIGFPSVKFQFENITGDGNNLYIDDISIYDVTTVSNKQISSGSSVSIYPNPSNGNISADISLFNPTDKLIIDIYSVLGKRVNQTIENKFKSGLLKLNLSQLVEGVYFMEIKTDTEKIIKKFILQNRQ